MIEGVSVLYCDPKGPYPKLVADWWDESRNADLYAGGNPVVAHPPCGPYSKLRHLNRYQRPEHALRAVEIVRRVGGVLEHPMGSRLWRVCDLPLPGMDPDKYGGYSICVDQVNWGHAARKRTWLYIVGVPPSRLPEIPPAREPTHWCSGGRVLSGTRRPSDLVPPGIKIASAQIRRRTPPAFAAWLIELAARASLGGWLISE